MFRTTDMTRLFARIDALQSLLSCYRIGAKPSEKLHKELEVTRQWEEEIREGHAGPGITVQYGELRAHGDVPDSGAG